MYVEAHTYIRVYVAALPALMHSCMHTYIYTCDCSNAQLCLRGQLHAYMSMPHIHPSHISLTSSHIHHSDEPNAVIFQVLVLSHRAQVLNLALCHPLQRVTGVANIA